MTGAEASRGWRAEKPDRSARAGRGPLTSRQLQAIIGIMIGETNKETAARLGISPDTLKEHRQMAALALGLTRHWSTKSDLVAAALTQSLIEIDDVRAAVKSRSGASLRPTLVPDRPHLESCDGQG